MTHYTLGWLPVVTHVTYPSIQITLIYLFMVILSLNIGVTYLPRENKLQELILKVSPVILLFFLPIIFFNPHVILINPAGHPTRLDYLGLGGYILVSLLVLFIINNLLQVANKYDIKRSLISFLIFIFALIASEFIHESGHAFFILITGGTVTGFFPFPTILAGELNAGFVSFEGVPDSLVPLVLLGGEIFQWIVLIIGIILIYWKKFRPEIQSFLYILLIVAWLDFPLYTINNLLNLPHWFIIGASQGDIIQFSIVSGISIWIMLILALAQLIVGIIVIYFFYKNRNSKLTKLNKDKR